MAPRQSHKLEVPVRVRAVLLKNYFEVHMVNEQNDTSENAGLFLLLIIILLLALTR